MVFWYGEVDHCTNLAPPFFSLVVEEEIPRVTIQIEGAPGIPSDWVKCFWKSFAQFSIGNAYQHCFCYLVRPFCFGFEQPPMPLEKACFSSGLPGAALAQLAAIVNPANKPTKVKWSLSWSRALGNCGKAVL